MGSSPNNNNALGDNDHFKTGFTDVILRFIKDFIIHFKIEPKNHIQDAFLIQPHYRHRSQGRHKKLLLLYYWCEFVS